MAFNQQQAPFWDFVRSLDQQGAGVDHAEAPDFFGIPPSHHGGPPSHHGGPPSHHGGPHSHHGGTHPRHGGPHHGGGPFGFGFGGPWAGRGFGGPRSWGGPEGQGHGSCHGRRGRHCRRDGGEKEGEASRSRSGSPEAEGAEGEGAEGEKTDGEAGASAAEGQHKGPRGFGKRGHGRHGAHAHGKGPEDGHRRGGPGGRGGRGHRGHPFGPFGGMGGGPRGPRGGPGGMGAFDLSGLFNSLDSHPMGQQPWAQMLRQYAQQAGLTGEAQQSGETEETDAENTFMPPIDIFSTEDAYVLHIALPGAKKEDVGVNWDADKGVLNVAGVVYRHGGEEFLKTLSQSERKVGMFEREVKLPPGSEEKEEVDGDSITAKLEDGVLVVTVGKTDKDENWTEVKRIDVL